MAQCSECGAARTSGVALTVFVRYGNVICVLVRWARVIVIIDIYAVPPEVHIVACRLLPVTVPNVKVTCSF